MSMAAVESVKPRPLPPVALVGDETRQLMRGILANVAGPPPVRERRGDQRVAYPQLLVVTPVADDGRTPAAPPQTVVGKQLSEAGLSFFHPTPLPHRWAIVELESMHGRCVRLLVDLDWCRFTRQGWYESGGRFVRVAA